MKLRHRIYTVILTVSALAVIVVGYSNVFRYGFKEQFPAQEPEPAAIPPGPGDSLKYPLKDPIGDFVTDKPNNPFYLPDPANIVKDVEYDPTTNKYIITEKVGGEDIKEPMYLTYDEYLAYTEKQDREAYFKSRSNAVSLVEDKGLIPPIDMKNKILDRLFGGTKIEVKPQGNLDLTLGGNYQEIDNPNIPIRNRHTGGFDFDMNINMNVVAKIGDKLQLGLKYNTQSGFDFDNQVKLGYTGKEDDIIKEIAIGNVSMPLPTRLISGPTSLFGVKTKLQFGRLTWTTVVSQQKSKTQSITLDNGALRQNFSLTADQYDENKDFFMAQYFRNHYDYALSNLPTIQSVINVTRLEVWVTNRNGTTVNVRNVVGLADLGESQPHTVHATGGSSYPDNSSNGLYQSIEHNAAGRTINNVDQTMASIGLSQGQDYEKTYARKLQPSEYTFNSQLGYLMLNTALNPNDILGIAVQYEVNGALHQVGEFSTDLPSADSGSTSTCLYLKLLKGSAARVDLPYYKLMMKNIYSIGAYQVSPSDFKLDVYYNDPGGGLKRFLPKGGLSEKPLISVLNLDNLDAQGDAQPDGLFDFVPNITIIPQNGRIIFPQVEPFGQDLLNAFNNTDPPTNTTISGEYIYPQLYDSTKFIALQFPQLDRFVIKGQYKGSNGSQVSLGGINIPKGSVKVTAGGTLLKEGTDYEVDYSLGKVTILNQGILNSGQQVKIDFENNSQFGLQQKSVYGTRLDYLVSKKFNIGATVMHETERPFTQKVQIGDDPISNTMFGSDVKYETNAPWLTKILDALPIYSTKEMSIISAYGEVAHLAPGHQKSINGPDGQGQAYIDDFEGSTTNYDLKNPTTNWKLASTPALSPGPTGAVLFPEAVLQNNFVYGMNRAKLAWYRIDNSFFTANTAPTIYSGAGANELFDPYTRLVAYNEIYPNAPLQNLDNNIYTFDLAYYPMERGPYNYELPTGSAIPGGGHTAGLATVGTNMGLLAKPNTRWGGIMRALTNTDLQSNNIEFIEFWMLDPFINKPASQGGQLYINLGNVSEDILKDGRMLVENGLNQDTTQMNRTTWGYVPIVLPLTTAFSSDADRPYEDVGFDGMNDTSEIHWFKSPGVVSPQGFLNTMQGYFGAGSTNKIFIDPSSDDYLWFDDNSIANTISILNRYENYNGPDGNTPVQNGTVNSAGTSFPDIEDLNNDFTLNEDEEYFQYRVDLKPGMAVGNNKYIVSTQDTTVQINAAGSTQRQTWYQFRIPIADFDNKVGNLPDFQSIQFMRVFLSGFYDTVVLRMATLDLIRNTWVTYNYTLDNGTDANPQADNSGAFFNVGKVNLYENASKQPVNYVIPPGIQQTYALGAQTNQYVAQNEQSLDLTTCGLPDGSSKAVFKRVSLDVRRYKHLKMFVHANSMAGAQPIRHDGEVYAFVRMGGDFTDNYYQYSLPLHMTLPKNTYSTTSGADQDSVWSPENNVDVDLEFMVSLKLMRDLRHWPTTVPYDSIYNGRLYTIVGSPDLSNMQVMMLGIKNPQRGGKEVIPGYYDDGQSKCAEVWFDELRVSQFDETGGTAALGEVAVKLADLGKINVTGSMHTAGFGQIEQKLDQRATDDFYQYSASANLELGKLLPVSAGIRLPFYGGITESLSTPEYDPYQGDIKVSQELSLIKTYANADSANLYKHQIETINIRKGLNFSGVRIMPKLKTKIPRIYDPANFTLTYSYNEITSSDPYTQLNLRKTHVGLLAWSFSPKAREFTPFKKSVKAKTKWLDFVKDFNFNLMPATLGFTTNMTKDFNSITLRSLGDDVGIPTTYSKTFNWSRVYTFKYNPFKSLSIDYSANNQAIIDELYYDDQNANGRDFIWNNIKNGGRNTNYAQNFATTYALPLNKIPALDLLTSNVGYASSYTWVASPEVYDSQTHYYTANPLGNTITNTQVLRGKADLNFRKLYDKSPFLKTYDTPNPALGDKKENDKKRQAIRSARQKILEDIQKLKDKKEKLEGDLTKLGDDKAMPDSVYQVKSKQIRADIKKIRKQIRQKHKDYRAKQMPPDPLISVIMRPLLSLKTAGIEYRETQGTTVAGFMPSTNILGNNVAMDAPGYNFAFGMQPGDVLFRKNNSVATDQWLNRAAQKGWISSDTFLNQQFTQNKLQRLDLRAGFEPLPDFKIDLSAFREYSDNYSEYFKVISEGGGFEHLTPMEMGSYTVSYVGLSTFFKTINNAGYSQVYNTFLNNRSTISQRLGGANPNSTNPYWIDPTDSLNTKNYNYKSGYGPKQQDVLVSSFLAAYTHKSAATVNTNPFASIPLPNWRVAYNGLTKIKWMKKIFTNFNLTHGYSSTITVSSFQTNLQSTTDTKGHINAVDSLSNNFFSVYNMPSIVINQQFSPLIGVDMTFTNKVSVRFDYKMAKTVTLSFSDFQLIENKSQTITAGAGYTIKGLKIRFIKIRGKPLRLDNDLKFKCDVSYRNGITVNHLIDESVPQITAGSSTLTISPAIDYMISKGINVSMFVDYSHTDPRVLSSFPTTNIKGGFKLKMSLVQ
jgi:cell surface protein SprA